MNKSELLLNPYKEHLKKPYLHGAGTLEINGVQYSADEYITMLEEANKSLKEENELLNNELAWMKAHTRYNGITKEEYIDGTMTATEAKLRLQQSKANQNYVSKLEEENRKLKEELGKFIMCKSKD